MDSSEVPIERGVYRITCKATEKSYIGSGGHTRARCSAHRSLLRAGRHKNIEMQSDWTVYGESAFEFVVLEVVTDGSKLLLCEGVWVKKYQQSSQSYNKQTPRGDCHKEHLDGDGLMTADEVAVAKQVTREAVRLAVKRGALKAWRSETPMLFEKAQVDEWTPYVAMMRRAAQARRQEG